MLSPGADQASERATYTAIVASNGCSVASSQSSNWVPIAVALIGLAGVIAAAVISKNSSSQAEPEPVSSAVAFAPESDPAAMPPPPVAITGVLIGRAGSEPFVSEVSTRFSPEEEVAITVRYEAHDEVSNFPVRLSARISSGFGQGVEEQIADVSRPGKSFWTFRFKPKDGWIGSQQFVWIEVDGQKAYSQTINISSR